MSFLVVVACLLQPAKTIRALPITAFGVSSDGQTVVGRIAHDLGVDDEPCCWTKEGGVKRLDRTGFQWGTAYAASHDGSRIVGLVSKQDKRQYVVLWERGQKLQVVAPWEGSWQSHGHFPSISGDGRWVVGSSQSRPFRWSKTTGIQFLQSIDPKLKRGIASAASYDGSIVVGGSENSFEPFRNDPSLPTEPPLLACLWGKAGSPSLLEVGKYPQASAVGVSDDGRTIAGNASPKSSGVPFIWTRAGGVKLLPELPGYTTNVWGLSPDGSLVLGYSSPDRTDKPWMSTVWKNGKPMTTQSFLESLKVAGLKSWKIDQVRASSRSGSVIIGQGTSPAGKYVSWVVY